MQTETNTYEVGRIYEFKKHAVGGYTKQPEYMAKLIVRMEYLNSTRSNPTIHVFRNLKGGYIETFTDGQIRDLENFRLCDRGE